MVVGTLVTSLSDAAEAIEVKLPLEARKFGLAKAAEEGRLYYEGLQISR